MAHPTVDLPTYTTPGDTIGGDESRIEPLPDKCTIQLKAGDILRMLTPGGGGWGTPSVGG